MTQPRDLVPHLPVPLLQAGDAVDDPSPLPVRAPVTVVGGLMAGIETADLRAARGCRVIVLEMQGTSAPEMAAGRDGAC